MSNPDITSMLGPTLGLIVVYFIILGGAYYFGSRTAFAKAFFKSSSPPAIAAVVLFVGLYLIVVTISAQFASDAQEFAYSVAAATFGLTLGWVMGIVISPSSKDEASEFSMLTKAISTFLTGYVLANLKGITKQDLATFLGHQQVPFRLLIGSASCLSSLAAVFVIRRAEVMAANAAREWFIRYKPADPQHAQALKGDFLARGPFSSRADALAEIERIKNQDAFKDITLTAERVEIFSEESEEKVPEAAASTPAADDAAGKQPPQAPPDAAADQPDKPPKTQEEEAGADAGDGGGSGAVPPNSEAAAEVDANAPEGEAGSGGDASGANGAPVPSQSNAAAGGKPKPQ